MGAQLDGVDAALREGLERALVRHADADLALVSKIREASTKAFGSVLDRIGASLRSGELPDEIRARIQNAADDPEIVKRHHIRTLHSLSTSIAETVDSMRWVLAINETSSPFCTSDDPVVMLSIAAFQRLTSVRGYLPAVVAAASEILGHVPWSSADGTLNKDLVVLFPLSPTVLLMLTANQTATAAGDILKITDEVVVLAFNGLQAIQAREFVFADHGDLLPLAGFASAGRAGRELIDRVRKVTRRG